MAILHDTLIQAGFKESGLTDKEALLTLQVGDLHEYIPQQLNKPGITQAHVARTLGVSTAWLSRWLSDNGYKRTTRWERRK